MAAGTAGEGDGRPASSCDVFSDEDAAIGQGNVWLRERERERDQVYRREDKFARSINFLVSERRE